MVLWNGSCMVHEIFSESKLLNLKSNHPDALVIAHPECEDNILKLADFIGSTTQLLKLTQTNPAKTFIVVTETGILHQMMRSSPYKTFIPAPPNNSCACNDCPHMKRNTLEKIYQALLTGEPNLQMDPSFMEKAVKPIKKMLELSKLAGLV